MPETFTVSDSVELAVVERSGFVESRHAGAAVVLDPDGVVALSLGDVETPILPRSSLKPLQALGCVTAGAALEGERLALATASHAGTDRHVAVVRDILDAAGLDESDLRCPPAWPSDTATRDGLVRSASAPQRVRMNCSGKHAAMLLACTANGWDTEGYLDPGHPLQVHLRDVVERLSGAKVAATAIDGCGAPVHAMSLSALGRAAHRIGTSSDRSPFALHRTAGALVRAVRELTPRLVVTGGGGYNPYTVGRCWAGVWAVLNDIPIPDRTTPAAESVLRSLSYNRAAGRNPPEHWFTTLRDAPRDGPVRDEVKRLAELALRETLSA